MHIGMVTRILVGARGARAMLAGRNSIVLMAVALITAGLLLRWDLVDWIIDSVGAILVLGGVAAGVLAIVKSPSARSHQTSP